MKAIHIENLTKQYRDSVVLSGIDLSVEEGEFFALMGPNGSGKTTLVSIISTVVAATEGTVEIYGRKPEQAKDLIAYVPQENFSSPLLSGRENLSYFAELLGYSGRTAKELVRRTLEKVDLWEEAEKKVAKYSGGMKKRLEVATALFPGTKILILDEPTTGLDPSARRKFFGLIDEIREEKTTVFLITHIGADAELAGRVGMIDAGRIVAQGAPDELKASSGLGDVISVETEIKNRRISDTLSGFSENRKVLETELGYRVYCSNADAATPDIVRSLDEIGCRATQMETIKPTLEDVFFHLTGKAVREVG